MFALKPTEPRRGHAENLRLTISTCTTDLTILMPDLGRLLHHPASKRIGPILQLLRRSPCDHVARPLLQVDFVPRSPA